MLACSESKQPLQELHPYDNSPISVLFYV